MLIDVGAASLPDGVVLERAGSHPRLRATVDLDGFATGWFARPAVFVELAVATGARDAGALGFAFTQFAMPVVAGPGLDFDFTPAPNLHSPAAVGVLLLSDGDRCTLLAPLTQVHEQVLAVDDGRLRWGWHGDLDHVPARFETTLGVYNGASPTEVLEQWGADMRAGRPRFPGLSDNAIVTHLSYWTDNGAAYWYRTEPGRTIARSVIDAVAALHRDAVPVRAVELDSWFYPHETPRPIAEIGYPEDVPPTGMLTWTPRTDAFEVPGDGDGRDAIERFADELGRPPLVLHARHIAPSSPYIDGDDDWWVDLLAAQPKNADFFARWFADAARWGACCVEQDWMLMYWFGVRELRAVPDRALSWQRALDRHAGAHHMGLIWCMATPADIIAAAALDHVVAVRTSDDYRFAEDPAFLWTWFLTVNRLAAVLGLRAYKDCFFSQNRGPDDHDAIDGDEHSEVEALLAALSCGPVGIGDRIGHTDRDIVLRTCDDDGWIRHVDQPLGLVDDCLFGAPARGERLAWASTTATRGGRGGEVWTYVVALNTSQPRTRVDDTLDLRALGIDGARAVYDWRARTTGVASVVSAALDPRDWALFVVAPPGVSDPASAGDPTKYVVGP
ncbi:MAG TPA: Sip1-related alpha-galactosidase, partial [Acidimicrobiia bacterium]